MSVLNVVNVNGDHIGWTGIETPERELVMKSSEQERYHRANARNRENLPREHGFEPVARIEGSLPCGIDATLYRNGPGISTRFGGPLGHAFEGDGALSAVRIRGDSATFASKMIRTAEFLEEEERGKLLYGFGASWPRRFLNSLRGRAKTPANVNVMHWQGKLFAVPEGAAPYVMDAESLETLEQAPLGELSAGYHSAHPHRIDAREALFSFRILWGKENAISIFAYPDRGEAYELVRVPLDVMAYFHDFIATPDHLIFVIPPVRIDILRAVAQIGPFEKLFRWKPEEGTRILVVPIDAPEEYTWFEAEPFFVWHFANAFQERDRILVDLVHWPDFGSFEAVGSAEAKTTSTPSLRRISLDLANKSASVGMLSETPCEFPSVEAARSGYDADQVWSQVEREGSSGIALHDLRQQRAKAFWFEPGQLASEPNLLATPHELLATTLVYDLESHTSFLAMFEANHIEDGPIARVWLSHHIPMTFHGEWV